MTYSLETARARLQRNRFNITANNIIEVPKRRCGIAMWGCIDYLCKNHSLSYAIKGD